jgi:hypothetical protein
VRSRKIDATPLQYLRSRRDYRRESGPARAIAFLYAMLAGFVFVPLRVSTIIECSTASSAIAPLFLSGDDSLRIPKWDIFFREHTIVSDFQ